MRSPDAPPLAVSPAAEKSESPSFQLTPPPREQHVLRPPPPMIVEAAPPGITSLFLQPTPQVGEQPVLRPPLPMIVEAAPLEITSLSFKPAPRGGEASVRFPDAPLVAVSPTEEESESLSFQLTPPASEALVLAPAAPPVPVSPAPDVIGSHSFQLRLPTTGETPAEEAAARGERADPDSSLPATPSRQLTARKDGQLVLRLGLRQDDSAWVVECEVYPGGRASLPPTRPGPYRFVSREQARVFLDETEKALCCLGCLVDDRVENLSAGE